MLSQNSLIQEFLLPVPICCLTTCLTDLWSELSGETLPRGDRLVVVNQEELPIGVIYLHSLIPYFNSGEKFFSSRGASILTQPQSDLLRGIMQPLKILPGTLSVREFWSKLPELQHRHVRIQDWGVVNPDGKLLGLVDINGLVGFVASQYQLQEMTPQVLWGGERKHGDRTLRTSQTRSPQRATAMEQLVRPVAGKIATIEQVLEALPWPVKLQNESGVAITENLAWREEFGKLSNTEISVTPPAGSVTESTAVATPLATRVSHLLSDPESEAILMCSLSNGSEQSWKFFKVALELDLSTTEVTGIFPPKKFFKGDNGKHSSEESPAKKLRSPPKDQKSMPQSDRPSKSHTSETSSKRWEHQPQSNSPLSWCLIVAEDVTEQQQMAKELVAKNADLVQLNRLKDEFLACISHELKTPLTAVLGLSTLLKDQALGPLNERQARYAKMIYQSGQHLMRVVNDILDLTRIETGQLQLNWDPVELKLVCESALQQAIEAHNSESTAADHNVEYNVESSPRFTLEIEPGLDKILADHLRLRQMLYNLLSNALKFTPPEGAIGLNISRWQGWIAFTVWDTGIGIPGDKQHLIFQRFQQLENPLTRRFEGTGLGLVITQGLARAHGGDVTFISKEEEGSKFTILLPPAPSETGTIKQFPVRDRRLVLIVEAVPQYIEDVHDKLLQLGYRVAISRSGVDALEKARRLQPCAILLNPLLPLLSGWDLLTLLKSDPQTGHIPVIVTATVVDKKRALKLRADGCLSLPFSASELQDKLKYVVSVELPEVVHTNPNKLTILRLTATIDIANPLLIQGLRSQGAKAYQILEADDLEQAELLAEIWQPQVILVEAATALPDPKGFFQKLSQSSLLANLPIVTMDLQTTEVANQVPELMIFPCLADCQIPPDTYKENYENDSRLEGNMVNYINSEKATHQQLQSVSTSSTLPPANYLLQAIQFAAQLKAKANVLAVDVSILPDFYQANADEGKSEDVERQNNGAILSKKYDLMDIISSIKTMNVNANIGHSWSEVWQLIQQQSVDLLLLYVTVDYLVMPLVYGLKAIANMAHNPQIMIVYDRGKLLSEGKSASETYSPKNATVIEGELWSILEEISTKLLPSSLSTEELLQEIQQLLKDQK